jgi:hypothetical protein
MCQKIVEPEPSSPVCPKCGKEINVLNHVQSGRIVREFDGKARQRHSRQEFCPDNDVNTWSCPLCDTELFTDEEEAREFLRG